MKTKIIILLSVCVASCAHSFAQVRFVPEDPYNKYSIGIAAGFTTMYGDLAQSTPGPAIMLNFAQHMSSSTIIGVELMHATMTSTEPANGWTSGLTETGTHNAFNVNGRVTLAAVMKNPKNTLYKTLSGLYAGAGFGIITTDITSITNKFKPSDVKTIDPDFKKSSLAPYVPLNVGLNIYIKRLVANHGAVFNVNYQLAYTFSDYVDGYKFPAATTRNQYNDVYSVLSVGLSFYFGRIDEYR